jgi:chorismate synthase
MLRYLTSGESHGKALTGILEGFPAGVPIDEEFISDDLKRRQMGYGRSHRMQIEKDRIEILSGVKDGLSMGSPISILMENKDWKNWKDKKVDPITVPRPGHADLVGYYKYHFSDIRWASERASARETAMRVALGGFAKILLGQFNIEVLGHVLQIGSVNSVGAIHAMPAGRRELPLHEMKKQVMESPVFCMDPEASDKMCSHIDEAKKKGTTLGGMFEVIAKRIPLGLGSYVHWDSKLDGRIASALMSIQSVKAVEIGEGMNVSREWGSEAHDEIFVDKKKKLYRETNRAGGLEGGVTNGEDVVVRAFCKPISTQKNRLMSVDLLSKEPKDSSYQRSDLCVVPATSIVGEAVLAWEIGKAFLEKFGGDHLEEVRRNYEGYMKSLK